MRAIISRGLYTFYPISKDHLCTVTYGLMYGLYSRAPSNQERPMMARVRYIQLGEADYARPQAYPLIYFLHSDVP